MRERALSRPVLAGGGLVLLLALVALAASGRRAGEADGGGRAVSDGWIDVVFTLALIGMVLTLVLLGLSMRIRREDQSDFDLKRMLVVAAVVIAIFGGLAVGVSLLADRAKDETRPSHLDQGPQARNPGASPPRGPAPQRGVEHDPSLNWPILAVAGLVLAWLFGATIGRRWWRRVRRRRREEQTVTALREVLQEALDELETGDPRLAVIAAYAGMERTLALHGLPRRPAEAPLEYTARVLLGLHASMPAVEALADLFERARFSTHEIGDAHREEAIRALRAVRDELAEAA